MFIFRQWGYLRCIPANAKCPSVIDKHGKQRAKSTRNRVKASRSLLLIFAGLSQSHFLQCTDPGCLGQRTGKLFHPRMSVVETCLFPPISIYFALICPEVQVSELLNPIRYLCSYDLWVPWDIQILVRVWDANYRDRFWLIDTEKELIAQVLDTLQKWQEDERTRYGKNQGKQPRDGLPILPLFYIEYPSATKFLL